jgi:SAM-dependent methyltransferase
MTPTTSTDSGPQRRNSRRSRWAALAVAVIAVGAVIVWLNVTNYQFNLASRHVQAPDLPVRNAPFITSSDAVVDKMVELAELSPDDLAYDLGCGDGRIIITAALQTGCRGVGFDIDPQRVAEARENVKLHGVEHLVEIRQQDIFTLDLKEADAVLFYLLPRMNKKLIPQFQEMRPGSRLISHDFGLGDIKDVPPEKTERVGKGDKEEVHQVHRWTTPLKIPGR